MWRYVTPLCIVGSWRHLWRNAGVNNIHSLVSLISLIKAVKSNHGRTVLPQYCHSRSHDRSGKKLDNGVRFFSFPKWKKNKGQQVEELTKRRRMAWIAAVRRKDVAFNKILEHLRVCSLHFQSGECYGVLLLQSGV